MRVVRHFTAEDRPVFHDLTFETRPVEIRNLDGSIAFKFDSVAVPSQWSGTAADILARKYCRKAGIPTVLTSVPEHGVPEWLWRHVPDEEELANLPENYRYGVENDARQVFRRIVGAWTYSGWKAGYFDTEDDARAFYDELRYMLAHQMAAPNSPQWFNTGLHWAYGIDHTGEGYFVADESDGRARPAASASEQSFVHSCFIQSVRDDLVRDGGVIDLISNEAKIAKFGSGTGANFSTLRSRSESLANGGTSSGLLAALKASDRAAALVTAKGSTRRSSKMVIVDADHPEIEDYVDWKVREERKVASLVSGSRLCNRLLHGVFDAFRNSANVASLTDGEPDDTAFKSAVLRARAHNVPDNAILSAIDLAKHGSDWHDFEEFDINWDSDAYSSVSGQNSNNSIRVTDAFLAAVDAGSDWSLINRSTGDVAERVDAQTLWSKIARAAWASADPGIQYDTTINAWHTCPETERINGSNSCSEFLFLDDTGTTLASLNLRAFATRDMDVDFDAFEQAVRLQTLALEISVSLALYPSARIAERTAAYRPLGLGFSNLGGLLMASGIAYDSDEGRETAAALTALLTGLAYATSAEIAAEIGAFSGYAENRSAMLRVIRNHRRAAHGRRDGYEALNVLPVPLSGYACRNRQLIDRAREAWDRALHLGERHGFRNAQATVIAPTGTISLLMDCDTMGIEPDFALVKHKQMAGGGDLMIVNRCVPDALESLGYSADAIAAITRHAVGNPSLHGAPFINHETLRARGFTDQMLKAADNALDAAHSLKAAFTPAKLGLSFCARALGRPAEELNEPSFDLLASLGFTEQEVAEANRYCYGHLTVEGAPGLNPRHLPVFDCSVRCGSDGTRFLSVDAHLYMMAAVQPFVSGAISKTVNMPSGTTVPECERAFRRAADLGLKAVALYRDGSKLSQPLNAAVAGGPLAAHESDSTHPFSMDAAESTRHAERIVATWMRQRLTTSPAEHSGDEMTHVASNLLHLAGRMDSDDGDGTGAIRPEAARLLVQAISLGLSHGVGIRDYEALFASPPAAPEIRRMGAGDAAAS